MEHHPIAEQPDGKAAVLVCHGVDDIDELGADDAQLNEVPELLDRGP